MTFVHKQKKIKQRKGSKSSPSGEIKPTSLKFAKSLQLPKLKDHLRKKILLHPIAVFYPVPASAWRLCRRTCNFELPARARNCRISAGYLKFQVCKVLKLQVRQRRRHPISGYLKLQVWKQRRPIAWNLKWQVKICTLHPRLFSNVGPCQWMGDLQSHQDNPEYSPSTLLDISRVMFVLKKLSVY